MYIKYKKYGAPIIATTIPAGTPPGCNIILPIVSAITSKHAPTKMAIGKTTGDVIQRYVWQYAPINPINEIEPATATAADDNITAIKNNIKRSLLNLTPRPRAILSPV